MGRIGAMLASVQEAATPLLKQIEVPAHRLTLVVLSVAATAFVLGKKANDVRAGAASPNATAGYTRQRTASRQPLRPARAAETSRANALSRPSR